MSIKTFIAEFAKDAPLPATAGATLAGIQLDQWVLILAVIYGVGRIVWLGVEAYWKWKDRQDGKSK